MLKRFTVDGYRNFSAPVSFNFAASRDTSLQKITLKTEP